MQKNLKRILKHFFLTILVAFVGIDKASGSTPKATDSAVKTEEKRSRDKVRHAIAPYWSAGLISEGRKRTEVELTLGPRYCDLDLISSGIVQCYVSYLSIGGESARQFMGGGIGMFGHGHGIPGGLYAETGFWRSHQDEKRSGTYKAITFFVLPVLVPLTLRWFTQPGERTVYEVAAVFKFSSFLVEF